MQGLCTGTICPGLYVRDYVQGYMSGVYVQGLYAGTMCRDCVRDYVQGLCVRGMCAGTVCRDCVRGLCAGTMCGVCVRGMCAGYIVEYIKRLIYQYPTHFPISIIPCLACIYRVRVRAAQNWKQDPTQVEG